MSAPGLMPRIIDQARAYRALMLTEDEAERLVDFLNMAAPHAAIIVDGSPVELRDLPVTVLTDDGPRP